MAKKYFDYLSEISGNELFDKLLGYGLFTSRLPKAFSSTSFLDFVKNNPNVLALPGTKDSTCYLAFENIKNNGFPRRFGIPDPFNYGRLCKVLKDHWDTDLLNHFKTYTEHNNHNVSRIFIRKYKGSPYLFQMNYNDWIDDPDPDDILKADARYLVKADISRCFESIYTHSVPWAIMGKAQAKRNKKQHWANNIDLALRLCSSGETHGIIVGPHASNLISEIILVVVDKELLDKGYKFTRHIDDYTAYVKSRDEADAFIMTLGECLSKYSLQLNHKKTLVQELPVMAESQWKCYLDLAFQKDKGRTLNYRSVSRYFDLATDLYRKSDKNAAVFNYAIKILSSFAMTKNGATLFMERALHLTMLFPYLVQITEQYVFQKGLAEYPKEDFINGLYEEGLNKKNYEAATFALYFALLHDVKIESLNGDINFIVSKENQPLYNLFLFLYFTKNKNQPGIDSLKAVAKQLSANQVDFMSNWLFVYECLDEPDIPYKDWQDLKKADVSFIDPEFALKTIPDDDSQS